MSVDRLSGSGTADGDAEPARRRGAQRRRTGRRPGTDAGAVGLAEPGQAGEATAAPESTATPESKAAPESKATPESTAAPESNVILLGQEAGPGRSATAPKPPA